jgi:hypothetical protein
MKEYKKRLDEYSKTMLLRNVTRAWNKREAMRGQLYENLRVKRAF